MHVEHTASESFCLYENEKLKLSSILKNSAGLCHKLMFAFLSHVALSISSCVSIFIFCSKQTPKHNIST